MDWRKLLERIGAVILFTVAGSLGGGFLGSLYHRLSESATAWDGLALVLGGLGLGSVIGLVLGLYVAIRSDDDTRRRALLIAFLFDLGAIVILVMTNVLD